MIKLIFLAMCSMSLLAGCNKQASTPEPKSMVAPEQGNEISDFSGEPKIQHNYEAKEGDVYMYVTAVSDEEKKNGKAVGDVLMYRYVGKQGAQHVLNSVDDAGNVTLRHECSDPCKIIKTVSGSRVSRIPYSTDSVIGAAFEDAIEGRLEVSKQGTTKTKAPEVDKPRPQRIPAAFVGEWNEDTAACGTGLNDTALRVTPAKMEFYESDAEVSRVQIHNSRAVTVQASSSGEGQTWNNSFQMVLSRSGNDLTIDGFTRHRCP